MWEIIIFECGVHIIISSIKLEYFYEYGNGKVYGSYQPEFPWSYSSATRTFPIIFNEVQPPPPPAKIQLLLALVEHGIRTWSEWILHLKRALNYIFLYLCCNLISIIFFVNIVYKLNTRRTMIYAFPPCTLSDTICCQ